MAQQEKVKVNEDPLQALLGQLSKRQLIQIARMAISQGMDVLDTIKEMLRANINAPKLPKKKEEPKPTVEAPTGKVTPAKVRIFPLYILLT